MIDPALLIVLFGVMVFLAHFFSWIFSFTAIPDGLLLMLVGLVLGLWIGPEFFGEFGSLALTIALVIILFVGGTNLSFATLRQAWSRTLRLTVTSFVVALAGSGLLLWLVTDLPLFISFIVGAIVAGTSSAIVIPLLDKLSIAEDTRTLLVLESAFSDVLVIVIAIAMLEAYATGTVSIASVGLQIVVSFLYAALVGVASGLIWSLFLDQVRTIRNSIFVTPAFVFILFGLVEAIGFSGPIAALAFGVTLGNIGGLKQYLAAGYPLLRWLVRPVSLSRRERAFFSEIVFLLQTFFFVFVGISITISNVWVLLLSLGLSLTLLGLRVISVRASLPKTTPVREATLMGMVIPKGLAAAVLATFVAERGIEQATLVQDITYGVILWSIVVTSLFVFLLEKTPVSRLLGGLFRGFGTQPLPTAASTIAPPVSPEQQPPA